MSWLFGTYSLWLDALCTVDARGKNVVLLELDMLCFIDSDGSPSECRGRWSGGRVIERKLEEGTEEGKLAVM